MYHFKSEYLYYISDELNKTYVLNCVNNEIIEFDEVGTNLLRKLLKSESHAEAKKIIKMFEGWDFFEE